MCMSLSGSGTRKEDTDKVKILETLEEKWSDIDKKAVLYNDKYQDAAQSLQHIRSGIESIFRRIGCSLDDLPSGTGTSISEANMMTFLAVIEHRTNDLLRMYDQLRKDEDEDFTADNRGKSQGSTNLQIKLPSTVEDYSDDEDDDDEDDQRPFTRDELKTKTMRGISKKQKKSKMKSVTQ